MRVGDREHPDAEIERFRAELDLASLLKGEFRVVQMTVERPHFNIDLADLTGTGRRGGGDPAGMDPERVSLSGVEIGNGTATIVDSRSLRQWQAQEIRANVSAGTLAGPARIEGGMVLDGRRLAFDLGIGRRAEDGALPIKLGVTPVAVPFSVNLDGTLAREPGEAPAFTGRVSVAGLAQPAGEGAPAPAFAGSRGSGLIDIHSGAIEIDEFQLSVGTGDLPLLVDLSGHVEIGAEPRFRLDASARQIDLDRTLSGQTGVAAPTDDAAGALVAFLGALPSPPIPGDVRLDAAGIVTGGSVVQSVSAHLQPVDGGWRLQSLSAVLPGETRLEAEGTIGTSGAVTFSGHAAMGAQRPAVLAAWLDPGADTTIRIEPVAAEADLDLRPGEQSATNLRAIIGGGTVTGSLTRRRFEESDQSFVTVDLDADRFDAEDGQALVALFGDALVDRSAIEQMSLKLDAGTLLASGVEATDVALDATYQDDALRLARLSVGDLAGAGIEAQGRIDDPFGSPGGRLTAEVKADDLAGAVRIARMMLPDNPAIRRFEAIAPDLTPLSADLSVESEDDHLSVDLRGRFAGTSVVVDGEGTGGLDDLAGFTGTADLLVTGDDTSALLAQFGLDPLPLGGAGPARIEARFDGSVGENGSLEASAALAGSRFTFDGTTGVADGAPTAAGSFDVTSDDIDPLLIIAGFALPGIGEGHSLTLRGDLQAAPGRLALAVAAGAFDGNALGGDLALSFGTDLRLSGDLRLDTASLPGLAALATGSALRTAEGEWQGQPMSATMPDALVADLDVAARALDLGYGPAARNAEFGLRLGHGRLDIDLARADLAGGALSGALTSTIGEGEAQMALNASLEGAALQELVWQRQGRPVATGRLDASINVAGGGRSAAGIVSSLTGSGSFTIADGSIRALNPGAFDNVIRAADAGLETDSEHVAEVYAGHLDSSPMDFGRASGSFSVASGMIRVPTVSLTDRGTTALVTGTIDLNEGTLDSDWSLRAEAGDGPDTGSAPQAGLAFAGPVEAPARQIDVTSLVGYLTVRRFEQEVERVEKLQAEILERDRLNRLMRLSREQAARREREAAAQAEAERQAAEAAAEQAEAERQAAEAEAQEQRQAEPMQLVPQPQAIPLPPRPQAPLDLLGPGQAGVQGGGGPSGRAGADALGDAIRSFGGGEGSGPAGPL